MRTISTRVAGSILAVLLAGSLSAACVTVETAESPESPAPDDLAVTVPEPEAPASSTAAQTEPTTTAVVGVPTSTNISPPATTTTTEPSGPASTTSLPDTPVDTGPAAGTGLAIVGVAHDDVLNVRDAPNGEIIAKLFDVMEGEIDPAVWVLPPDIDETDRDFWPWNEAMAEISLKDGIRATGNARRLPTTIWYEINAGPVTGWASAAYLASIDTPAERQGHGIPGVNVTERVLADLGEPVLADTLTELGMLVAEALHPEMSGPQYRRQVVGGPGISEGIGDVTIDVLSSDPAAIYGHRISIAAYPNPDQDWMAVPVDEAGPFTLWKAWSANICSFRC